MAIKIVDNIKSIDEYKSNYDYRFNPYRKKIYSEDQIKKYKHGKFYKVKDNAYLRLPLLSKKGFKIASISTLSLILVAGIATPVAVFYMPHKVILNSKYLEIVGDKSCHLASDYRCTFKIKDEYISSQYMNNINISAVKVNGNKIPAEDFYFTYQNNAKNELVIDKKYLGSNIEIDADLIDRVATHHCFFFGYEDFTFTKEDVIYPSSNRVGDYTVVKEDSTTDNMQLKDGYDMAITKKGDGPIHFNYNAFIVKEDNAFEIRLHALEGKTLPENLWFRCYAKFTKKDTDFTINFSDDYKEAILKVNYYVIRDSGSIVPKPEDA